MLYMASSASLATLEILVPLHHEQAIAAYSLCIAELAYDLIQEFPLEDLPADWQIDLSPASTAEIGDQWIDRGEALGLLVPSTIVPIETTF